MKRSSKLEEADLIHLVAQRRRQYLYGMGTQRLSSSPLQWGALQRPRWLTMAAIVIGHVVVLSAVNYFNASAMIEALPPVFVGVIAEHVPAIVASPVKP